MDRLRELLATPEKAKRIEFMKDTTISSIEAGEGFWTLRNQDEVPLASTTRPILANGFHSGLGIVTEHFEHGNPVFTEEADESTLTSGLFYSGPALVHRNALFCFIYKFRAHDSEQASAHDGWLDSLVEHTPETEEYGISNFIYERRVPFHPQRFYDCLQKEWPGVIRSKGVFWLATRLSSAGFWSQAGAVSRHQCAGYFWAAVPKEKWPEDRAHIDRVWKGENGDCRQEIVLIGRNMDQHALIDMLNDCLLTEDELASDHKKWAKQFPDPFPKWKMGVL